jgi:hypothetical protein
MLYFQKGRLAAYTAKTLLRYSLVTDQSTERASKLANEALKNFGVLGQLGIDKGEEFQLRIGRKITAYESVLSSPDVGEDDKRAFRLIIGYLYLWQASTSGAAIDPILKAAYERNLTDWSDYYASKQHGGDRV